MSTTPDVLAGLKAMPRARQAALLLGIALLVLGFWWTGEHLIIRWEKTGGYYGHGWLVPPASLAMLWMRRRDLAAAARRPCAWGLVLVLLSLLTHMAGTRLEWGFVSGFALIGLLAGLVLTLWGRDVLRIAAFPLLFLVFMVPIPEDWIIKVSFYMKLMAATVAAKIVDILGMTVIREGSILHLPASEFIPRYQRLVVDDVCSGLKYLISLTAFGAIYAAVFAHLRPWARWLLFALSAPVSFIANVIRILCMIFIAFFWGVGAIDNEYLHYGLGMVVFVSAYLFLFLLDYLMQGIPLLAERRATSAPAGAAHDPASGAAAPQPPAARLTPPPWLQGLVLGLLALSAAGAVAFSIRPPDTPSSGALAAVPRTIGEWHGEEVEISEREKAILGTQDVLSIRFRSGAKPPTGLLVVVAQQARRRTHEPQECFTGEGYFSLSVSARQVNLPSLTVPMREVVFARENERRIVWYVFKSGPDFNPSHARHHFGVAVKKLLGRPAPDVLIRLDTSCTSGEVENARHQLDDFAREALPSVFTVVP